MQENVHARKKDVTYMMTLMQYLEMCYDIFLIFKVK